MQKKNRHKYQAVAENTLRKTVTFAATEVRIHVPKPMPPSCRECWSIFIYGLLIRLCVPIMWQAAVRMFLFSISLVHNIDYSIYIPSY